MGASVVEAISSMHFLGELACKCKFLSGRELDGTALDKEFSTAFA